MILQLEHWHLGYAQILRDCRSSDGGDGLSSGTVWILCNADVDAMSAARILCYMLRSDGVTYQLRPCTSYSALHTILQADGDKDNVRAIVLLNLGASRNLTKLFDNENDALLTALTKVYVMDCRRPFHLANVHAGENVVLFWDEVQDDDIPSDGDNLSGNESTSSEEDSSSESESEAEFDDRLEGDDEEEEFRDEDDVVGDGVGEFSRIALKKPDIEEERDYDGEDEDDEDEGEISSRRRSRKLQHLSPTNTKRRKTKRHEDEGDAASETTKEEWDHDDDASSTNDETAKDVADPTAVATAISPRELHRHRRNRLRLYYSGGSFYGSPAAYVTYRLSAQLRFGELGDLLWLACVGVTDAYLHSRLDVAGYTALAMNLRHYCLRLYPNDMFHRVGNAVYAEHLMGKSSHDDTHHLTSVSLSETGRILSENDFRFFLLRHTSLFDSMVHSSYVSTKLQLWTNRGMQKLQEMLAKMGCPLEECRQPYAFMKPSFRRSLREKIETYADEYGLDNFEFTSFKRVTGYKSLLSASDTSYAVTALLECDTPATKSSHSDEIDSNNIQEEEEREALQAFNIAFDALNSNASPSVILNEGNSVSNLVNGGNLSGNTGIGAGIRLAMSLQKSIIATAVSLVDRNAITRLRHFRYAYITCTSQDNQGDSSSKEKVDTPHHIFAKPLALTKLAHFLMDMHRENGKWSGTKSRPLVLLAEKPRTSTFVVVGYEYPERAGNFVKNRFGQNFEMAAKTMKGTFKFDSFDSNVVEVDGADVQRFIEQLHYMMDSL